MAKVATSTAKSSNKNGIRQVSAKVSPGTTSKNSSQSVLNQNLHQEISALAYSFFVERGYEHGHDVADWKRAEAMILSKKNSRLN